MYELDISIYQKNFYLEWRMDPDSSKYNTCLTFEINGPLNIEALKSTVAEFINHDENQRTYFTEENGVIKQVIVDRLNVEVEEYDLSSMDKDLAKKESDKILHDIYNHVFDLHQLPLFLYGLIRLGEEKFVFVINSHHVISDAFSASYLIDYVSGKYNELAFGESFDAETLPKIKDYINYEKEYYAKAERDKDLVYWQQELSDVPLRVDIPDMKFDKKEAMSKGGGSHYFNLDLETSNKLRQFARANRATPFLVLSAIWALLSSRYSGQKDIVLHYPINARPPKFRGVLGCFINTVLMKVDVDQTKSVCEFVSAVVQKRKETKAYQRTSLSDIVQSLRSSGIYEEGAFNLSIASTNLGLTELNLNDCICRAIPRELQHLDDLALHFEFGEQIGIMLDHNGALFDEKSIVRLSQNFKKILDQFILFPNKRLKDLRLLTAERRKQILIDWNDTKAPYPKDKTIHELFEAQVKKTPKNIAVVFEDKELSYQALNEKANQLARLIRAKYKKQNKQDLKPDSLIGLCVERSLDMIIGILGIIKAGAAYVPLDPDYPQDRLEYMIEDSHEGLIITQKEIVARDGFLDQLHHEELLIIDSDEIKAELEKQSSKNLEKVNGPNDLAYVIYTSGSTGRPKGVMVEHDGVINRINWMHKEYGLNKNDKVLQKTPFSFDVSVWELLWAITYGGQLVFAKPEGHKDPKSLLESIEKFGITKIHFVPSMLQVFMDYIDSGSLPLSKLSSLKAIFCSGEALSLPLANQVLDKLPLELNNLYGPTEASIDVAFYDCIGLAKSDLASVPIGKAIDNTKLYIFDRNHNPCPVGAPGELYIGGAGLARGYLNQEELTKERFIPNPFADEVGLPKSDRIYKTGDLVRWLPDGNIEYLGRTDFQVKIRGFRIELGEIENVLAKHEAIFQVAVIDKEKEGQKYLAAYYVSGKDKEEPEVEALRVHLLEKLPDYMVPAAFVKLDEMPLTPNGKINRRALPDPDMRLMGDEYVAPRNELEEQLAQIWCDILKLEQIGIHDNFLSMGGDSIISIQLVSRARDRDLYFTPKDLFQNPTIAQLAVIDLKGSVVESEQGLVSGEAALIPIQSWFFEQAYAHRDHSNQAQLLQVGDSLDVDCLEAAFLSLIHHHDALRLRYRTDGKGIQQYYDDAQLALNITVQTFDLSKSKNPESELTEHCSAIQASLNIASGPVLAAAVFKGLGDGKDRLLIAIHHLMVDGVSWRIILPDLESCYQQIKAGKAVKLAPKTSSYQDWGHALHQYTAHQAIDDLDYWLTIAQGIKPLAYDLASPLEHAEHMDHVSITWDKAHTQDLLSKTQQAYNTQINDLLLSAFALALANWQQIDRVSFNLEAHGREDAVSGVDLSRSVGWFTSLFPVTLNLPEIEDLNHLTAEEYKSCIQSIKEQIRQIPDKGLSYGVLKYLHPDQSIRDQFKQGTEAQVSFNYLGQFGDAAEQTDDGWGFAAESSGAAVNLKNHHPNVLDLNGMVVDGQLSFSVAFSTDHFKQSAIDQFSELFKQCVLGIVEHCVSQDEVAYTPSDFATAQLSQGKLDEILSDKSVDKIYALSPLQEAMLFHALHAQDSDQYCVQLEWTYEGQLDPDVLKTAWDDLIHHHDILRTRFIWQAVECPIQVVEQSVEIPWFVEDLSQFNAKEQRKQLKAYALKDRFLGFDLSKPCVMRLHLIKLSEREYHFIWTNHHILLDGWCNPILLKELLDRYAAIRQGKTPVVRAAISYERYIEFIKAQDKKEAEKFWADALGEIEGPTDIKVQKAGVKLDPNKPIKDLGSVKHCFDIAKTKEMEDFAKVQKVTINSFVQLAWANTLSRYSGESDVIYGSVLSGRSQALFGIDQMVGLLINTLPMVVRIDGNQSVAEHLRQVHQRVQEVNDYDYCGLSEVQRFSQVASGNPLFNVLFVFENYPTGEGLDESDWVIKDVQSHEKTNYPISVMAYVSRGQLELKIDYDKACFSDEVMESLLRHMTNFMLRAILEANQAINQVKILDTEERQQILIEWNDTEAPYPKDKTMYELFEAQVKKTPQNIAVVFEDEQLTYQALNEKANQLARLIRAKYKKQNKQDLKPDSLIGLCVERSLDMIVGILGILKAGAAYVPLDPDYPQDRLEYMIEDSHEGLIIAQKDVVAKDGFLDKLHHDELLVIDSDEVKLEIKKQSVDNLEVISGPNDLAYVIYTSGSTGKPKGVMVEHASVSNYMNWLHGYLDLDDQTSSDCSSNIAFDFTLSVSVASLIKGHKVFLCSDDRKKDLSQYVQHLIDNNISYVKLTPGYLSILLEHIKSAGIKLPLRKIILGGEALNITDVRDWLDINPGSQFYNEYGPTEATVGVSQHTYTIDNRMELVGGTLIGSPGFNIRYYVLDANFNPCPIGAPGELYIAGDCLARGYLNKEDHTKERFISNPFAKELGLEDTDKIYKTGDLVRWLSDGNIEYLGRTDLQVKIRGFRVELGEIENVLSQHGDISRVVVTYHKEKQQLICYYVAGMFDPGVDALKDYLSKTLPDYMVPNIYIILDEIPLTLNGKINRKALPDPDVSLMGEEYIAPRNEIEQKLAQIWSDVLKIDKNKVGIHDNFFHLGGHSLLAIQLVSHIHARFNCELSIKQLFDQPKLIDLAELIAKRVKEGVGVAYSPIKKTKRLKSGNAMSFAQERLWFLDQFEGQSANYNMPMVLRLEGQLNVKALEASINQLIARHDSLRTVFSNNKDGVGVQKIREHLKLKLSVQKVDAKGNTKAIESVIETTVHAEINRPFDLEKGPLVRVCLYKVKTNAHVFIFNHHHIISDGVSTEILINDLSEFYQANIEKREATLEKLPIQYVDFAAWQRAEFEKPDYQNKLQYWQERLSGYSDLPLPVDKARPKTFTYQGSDFNFSLDKALSDQLVKLARENGTTLYMVLLTAFNVFLSRYSGSDDIILGSPIANRYHHDTEGLVGFFVNTLILRNEVDSNQSVKALLSQISQDTLSAFDHQMVPFEQIVEQLDVTRDTSRNPIVQVLFSLQSFGQDTSGNIALNLPGISITPYDQTGYDVAKFDLSLFFSEGKNGLVGNFNYCTDLFHQETIERMARNFERLLGAIVKADADTQVKDLRLLTDERRQQILIDWNDTKAPYPKDKTIHELFEAQAKRTPNNIAVVFEDDQLTYQALNEKANQLARLIRAKYKKQNKLDLKPDSLIGLCVERSLDMIVGILGILKAGAAYVPLDPDYPQDRLEYMIEDSHEGLIIAQKDVVAKDGFLDKLHHDELLVIDSDEVKLEIKKQSVDNLEVISGPNDLAYVIYTSGSTGKPKGVMVEHASVSNYMNWLHGYLDLDDQTSSDCSSNIAFDFTLSVSVASLIKGHKVFLCSDDKKKDLSQYVQHLIDNNISYVKLTPGYLSILLEHIKSAGIKLPLRKIILGGEALNITDVRDWLDINPGSQFYNEYGPTEATVGVSQHTYTIDNRMELVGGTLIGSPGFNIRYYVLDANFNPCPIGAPGELYIAGDCLARGYLNKEDHTKERFISNPFAKELGLEDTDKIYKTGDLVRWLSDGNIEYLGRTDLQVKIRGFRVELGEIENVLSQHGDISRVVVTYHKEKQQLICYYVAGMFDPGVDALKDYLSKTLPDYMVPNIYIILDEIPLTLNGKINRKALPDPDVSLMGEEYIAPRNEIEQKLAKIWSDVLKIDKNKVGIHDNFFHLGGHSLLAIQLVSHIHARFNCELSIKQLFDQPKLIDLAELIAKRVKEGVGVAYSPIKKTKRLKSGNAMSFAQERLWFLDQFEGQSANYNMPMVLRLEGQLNVKALEASINQLIARHDSLRTVFSNNKDGVGVQKIREHLKLKLSVQKVDAKGNTKAIESVIETTVHAEINRPFDLEKGPLVRVCLYKVKTNAHVFIFNHHHIISDGVSTEILINDLSEFYQANIEKREATLEKLPIQYVDFAAWQRAEFEKPDYQNKLQYWQERLSGYSDLPLPVDKARPKTFTYQGSDFNFSLDKALSDQLVKLARENGTTLYMVLLTAFNVFLSRCSGSDDIILGSPIANRYHHDTEGLVGFFVNTLILRNEVDSNKSVKALLSQISQDTLSAFDHQMVPFEQIVEQLDVTRDTSRNPIVQVMFSLQSFGQDTSGNIALNLPGISITPYDQTGYDVAKFDLSLFFSEGKNALLGNFNYCTDLFHQETIERMARNFERLLGAIVEADADTKVKDLRLLTDERRQQILIDWNDTKAPYPKDKTIHELFEAQAKRTPNNIAVVFEDDQLTYQALNEKANQLARLIRAKYKKQNKLDLKPDSLIGLCVERSLDMIVGILGILKSGAAYVPLDPDYPQDRLEYMIEDSHEGLIITQKDIVARDGFLDKLHHDELLVIDADGVKAELSKQSDANLDTVSGPDSLAYVIYTSGSTGRPKGVMVEHKSVNSFAMNSNYIQIGKSDRVAQLANMAFDAIVFEVWSPLLNGGEVIVFSKDSFLDLTLLGQLLQKKQVSIIFTTTAIFNAIVDQSPDILSSLRVVLFGGEAVNVDKVNKFIESKNKTKLIHVYGPTESTTFATYHLVDMSKEIKSCLPIGSGITNKFLYVLDNDLNIVPIGAPGELYISGDAIARGYLNQEELTHERFIPNPFAEEIGLPKSDRIYKTGDLVRWLPDGNIEYLGRTDFQVKIRGFRIELGEIENTLAEHSEISQVTVIDKDKEGQKYLAAYYVVGKDKEAPEVEDLRSYLAKTLPDYMVPAAFVKLDVMPLTPNGKINRKALPDPDMSLMGEAYVAPRNETEEKLVEVWSTVLKIDKDKIGIHANFFHLGGHSLLAIQLVSHIHARFNCELSIKQLFDQPKLIDLAELIAKQVKEGAGVAYSPIKKTKRLKSGNAMSFAQERLWFLDQFEGQSANYNIPMVLRLEGQLNVKALEASINQLIARHDSLRTVFSKNKDGVGVQKVLENLKLKLAVQKVDTKGNTKAIESVIETTVHAEIHRPFDLEKGPLVRVCLYKVKSNAHVFIFNHHHIISDGVSTEILINDLSEFYQANIERRESKLEKLPIQYVDFAAWQRAEFEKPDYQNKLEYWQERLLDYSNLPLPVDKARPKTFTYQGSNFNFSLDKALSDHLVKLARENGTTLYMVLLTAFNVFLSRYSGSDDIILGSPIANRYHHDTEGLVGFFVNTLILRNEVDSNKSVKALLSQISQDTLSAFDHQMVPFEQIVEQLDATRDTSRNPIVQVLFSLQSFGQDTSGNIALNLPGISITPYDQTGYDVAKFDLSLFFSEGKNGLVGNFNYCTDLFHQETIERMARNFERLLGAIVKADADTQVKDLRLLTDERRQQILIEWNDTKAPYPKDKTIYELFEAQVKNTPKNIAVVFEDKELSYQALNEKANQLARLIRAKYKKQNKKDLKPDSLIGLCVERSLDMIVGILGILKAGAAYVPLDPDYPQDRLEYMIEDSHEGLIITQKEIVARDGFLDQLHHEELLIIDSDEIKAELEKQSVNNLDKVNGPNDLAYVIYTSGSTGRPKGVMVEHNSVSNYMHWLHGYLDLDDQTRSDCSSNLAFDFTLSVSVASLIKGHEVCLCSDDKKKDLSQYVRHIIDNNISYAKLTPGYMSILLEYIKGVGIKLPLRQIILGGEALKISDVADWLDINPGCKFYNEYGPTEATVGVSQHTYALNNCMETVGGTLIGGPGANNRCYVLDANLSPCPIGAPGELYIGGAGLARGYLNQEALTRERFIPNPFAEEVGLPETDRIYKTGDLVRWLPDGNIEYLGRTDFQVKIRGFRVELGEIEKVLSQHGDISQVIVSYHEEKKQLVCYYVAGMFDPGVDTLKDYLSETLPDYMVPAAFVKLDEMPLTPNGKINRKALLDPDMSLMGDEYVAPRNDIEKNLAEIWSDVLKLDKVGIEDDFFRIGGDSILSIQLVSKMRNEGFNLLVKDVFNNKTIAQLSAHLASTQDSQIEIKSEQGLLTGNFDLLPIQCWFFDRMKAGDFTNPNHWNQSFLVKVEALELDKIKLLIPELVMQHDILRATYFIDKEGNWQQRYHEIIKTSELKEIDISKLSNKDELDQLLTNWQNNFDIEHGPLWQVGYLYGYPDGSARLFFAFHHLIIDSVSWRILIDDTKALYAGKGLSNKTCSYRQWVSLVNNYPEQHKDEKAYWEHLQKAQGDFLKYIKLSADKKVGEVRLNKDLTNKLLKLANKAYHTEINDLLLTALAYALKSCSNQSANYITLEGHGREHIDATIDHSRTIGWFTTAYPVKLEVQDSLDQSIKIIKESLRLIPNKGLGYGAFCADQNKKMSLPPISFNYLGQFDSQKGYWQVTNESSGIGMPFEDKDPNIININGAVIAGALRFSVVSHLSDKATKSFIAAFKKHLEKIIINCCAKIKSKQLSYTTSDFKDYIPYEIVNETLDMPPIVIFPPGGAGAEAYYNNLIPGLENNKIILFNNILDHTMKKLGEDAVKDMTFENLAKDYILRLKTLQPEGPYCLVGWSFGGVLAVEVARQLLERGDKISKLILLDPLFNRKYVQTQVEKMENFDVSNKVDDTNISMKYKPSKVTLGAKSIILFKAMGLYDTLDDSENEFFNYYVKNAEANFIEKVLNDDIEIINFDATHVSWVEFDDVVTQIVKKILE